MRIWNQMRMRFSCLDFWFHSESCVPKLTIYDITVWHTPVADMTTVITLASDLSAEKLQCTSAQTSKL